MGGERIGERRGIGREGVLRELLGGGKVRIRMTRDKDNGKRGEEGSNKMGRQKR